MTAHSAIWLRTVRPVSSGCHAILSAGIACALRTSPSATSRFIFAASCCIVGISCLLGSFFRASRPPLDSGRSSPLFADHFRLSCSFHPIVDEVDVPHRHDLLCRHLKSPLLEKRTGGNTDFGK